MSPYPSVAVVIADDPEGAAPDLTPEPRTRVDPAPDTVLLAGEHDPGQVAIAPDPSLRYILLASTKAAGEEEAATLRITPVAILTPRSPDGARGIEADQVIVTDGLTPSQCDDLLAHALPSLETTQA